MSDPVHRPVLVEEVMRCLSLPRGGVALDVTVGLGGHAQVLLEAMGPQGRLIAMDRDEAALRRAKARLRQFAGQVTWVHGHFGQLQEHLSALGAEPGEAVLFDLGVSSLQLETAERGFSFMREGPLDMRMDTNEARTAADIVNRASLPDLTMLLRKFGQERWAGRIARAIVRNRPIHTTTQLAQLIRRATCAAVGGRGLRRRLGRGIDPATRSFQAIRIALNRELELLALGLAQAFSWLKPNGRIAVLAYHSLEDQIVKRFFRAQARAGCLELLTRKPIRPGEEEVALNPRARSARLRAAVKRT